MRNCKVANYGKGLEVPEEHWEGLEPSPTASKEYWEGLEPSPTAPKEYWEGLEPSPTASECICIP